MNFELKVKEIPVETYILVGKINDQNIINNLKVTIKNTKDNELSYKTNIKGHFTGFQSLVENIDFINFLKKIQPQIKFVFPDNFIIQDAWGNILKKSEKVIEHNHSDCSFCGILYLTEGGPGTYFKEYDLLIKEEVGKFILFHPMLKHSVQEIDKDIERITVAFNMSYLQEWRNSLNIKWVNKNEI